MIRAVLDVNVLVSALISPSGTPARLLEAWRQGQFTVLTSQDILAEFERVIVRSHLYGRYGLKARARGASAPGSAYDRRGYAGHA